MRNDVYDRPPLNRWGRGLATLLGDAAHPTTPNMGQGANQALEDTVVLAQCFKNVEKAEGLSHALREYEDSRRARAAFVTRTSRRLAWVDRLAHPWLCGARNMAFKAVPTGLFIRRKEQAMGWPEATDDSEL